MYMYVCIYIYTETGSDERVYRLLSQNMQGTHAARMLTRMFFFFFLLFLCFPSSGCCCRTCRAPSPAALQTNR